MNHAQRRAIGAKVAGLVIEAERIYPAPKTGPLKRAWIMKEARKDAPAGDGASRDFARWLGAALLRVAIEAAVAVLNHAREQIP